MSLVQNEDFAIYQLRISYLANVHDGVGERLINVNTAFLNDPAFRAAGWSANPPEIKRCYSPPIPTAVTSEYFQAPRAVGPTSTFPDDDDEGGMITGSGSHDTVGPATITRRRRRREQHEEDDSSDLSDESDEFGDETERPVQQIRFAKMPERSRADSSPIRPFSTRDGADTAMTSPSRPPDSRPPRRGSLGAVEAIKERSRRNTTTSSEMSSENDLDPSVFQRRKIAPSVGSKATQIADQTQEEDRDVLRSPVDVEGDYIDSDSDDGSLASDLIGSDDSSSFFDQGIDALRSSPFPLPERRNTSPRSASPRKNKPTATTMMMLPPPRPISTVQPRSALAAAIKAKNQKPTTPFERFATLSGTGDPNPLYVKIFAPFSSKPSTPIELLLKRFSHEGEPITVAEAIGLSLWRYSEEKTEPLLTAGQSNVNHWMLRLVEDGEVEYDFPPLSRLRPMTDFTSNNNRGVRGRSRDKPWDEFALVEATATEIRENESLTPIFSQEAAAVQEHSTEVPVQLTQAPAPATSPVMSRQNVITGPKPLTALRKDAGTALDAPALPVTHATPRTGLSKSLNIHFTDPVDLRHHLIMLPVTTDTYIAEVFDEACKRFNLDKALYVLKVTNTTTVAPADRTVEALGAARSSLDLVRRRFMGDGAFGLGITGSPGSTSPNAPLLLTTSGTPKKYGKKREVGAYTGGLSQLGLRTGLGNTIYKRYYVLRKQPMSFAPSHPRVLALDGEYLQILPGETNGAPGEGKITSVHFSSVVGCKVSRKHPKTFRVVVFKERESKRYDFEAPGGVDEAAEIVAEIKKGTEKFRDMAGGIGMAA